MLKLREEQMLVLARASQQAFEDRALAHVHQYFTSRCEVLGTEGVREALQHGIERARSYGFTSERNLCKYLNLMFTFGLNFDLDPELPWAAELLGLGGAPSRRMARLYETALAQEAAGSHSPAPRRGAL